MGESVARLSRANQGHRCIYCEADLDDGKPNRGSPIKFCRKKPCKGLFHAEARRIGAGLLVRRKAHRPAANGLINLNAMSIPARQAALVAAARRAGV